MAARHAGGLIVFRRAFDAAIQKEIPEFLLVKAAYGDHHWSFPKGHTDPGETNYQAAWRETEEEVGLTKVCLKEIDFTRRLQYPLKGYTKVVDLWLAELIDKNAQVKIDPSEVEAFEWATLESALKLSGYESTRTLLSEADQYIKANVLGH